MHPILFQFHSITLYTYGLFMALAVAVVFWLSPRRAIRFGLPPSMILDLIFLLFISGVVGARGFYVLQHWQDYAGRWPRMLAIQEGGLVWYGGFLIAATAGLGYAWVRKWPALVLADFFAPLLALAHGVGRIGCFLNGCCFGREGWGPVQLFEAAWLFVLSWALFRIPPSKHRAGSLFLFYLLFYSAFRFFIEFARGDQITLWGLTPPQWTSLFLFFFALGAHSFLNRDKP